MLEKASALPADLLLLNLEDGVPPLKKDEARIAVARAVQSRRYGSREVVIRINSFESLTGQLDIEEAVRARPDGICLPKVERASEVMAADIAVTALEAKGGITVGSIRLHAMIESPAGVLHAAEIAAASPRMASLLFGSADYSKDLRCRPGEDRTELLLALQVVVTCARAAGIDALDAPCFDVHNAELLRKEAAQARRLGYDGKSAVHPNQIEPINAVFDVTPEEIAWAEKVISELDQAAEKGKGLSTLAGYLVEPPHRVTAERILTKVRGRT